MTTPKRVRIGKLWKKTRGGKAYGNWLVDVKGGERVNLRTKDAELATKRAVEAAKGVRDFEADPGGGEAGLAAKAIPRPTVPPEGTGGAEPPPVVEPPAPNAERLTSTGAAVSPTGVHSLPAAPAALPPIPASPQNGAQGPQNGARGAPIHPDRVYPPQEGWAGAVGAAAAAAAGDGEPETEAEEQAEAFFDADLIKQIVDEAATYAVELQIMGQAWLARRGLLVPRVKVRVAPVDESAKGRAIGKKLWTKVFANLMPTHLPIPDWLTAPLMVAALTIPVQLGPGASLVTPEEEAREQAAAESASPGAAAPAAAAA